MQKPDQNSQALGSYLCERAKHNFKSILWLRNPSSSTHQGLSGAGAVQLLRGTLGSRLPLTWSDFGALENSFQSVEGNAQHLWFIEGRMERQGEGWSGSQLHVRLSRDSEAAGPSAEPVLQGCGAGGAASSAASSSHWHDFLGSRARKDLKTELQPSNKFQLRLWEEALLAWPLVPCPYTFRRREQLRWMHIPRLSSWPAPAAMLWMGKLGAGGWAESSGNPCRSRCTSSVFVYVWWEYKSEEAQCS